MANGVFELSSINLGQFDSILHNVNTMPLFVDVRNIIATVDINGDSYADIVIGASGVSVRNESAVGQVYVVFGQSNPLSFLNLPTIGSTSGFIINGERSSSLTGAAVAGAGDINAYTPIKKIDNIIKCDKHL